MNKITIYLPIEIKVRELNSHVLLSKFASKLGMRIYIGSKDTIKRLLKRKNNKAGVDVFTNPSLNIIKNGWPRIDLLRGEFSILCKTKIEEIKKQVFKYCVMIESR